MPASHHSLKASAAALLAVALASPAISLAGETAEPPPLPAHLGMQDALRLFRERGFDLIVADAMVDSTRGDAQIAGAIPNPALSGGVGRSFGFNSAQCPGCSALAWSAGVSDQSALFDTLSGKRGLRSRTAELALSVARQNRADTQRTLESMLRQQYLEAVYDRDALDLAHESQGRLGHVLRPGLRSDRPGRLGFLQLIDSIQATPIQAGSRWALGAGEWDRRRLRRRATR